jgi:hypothetical protein
MTDGFSSPGFTRGYSGWDTFGVRAATGGRPNMG